jgi:hypothetical protein
VRGSFVSPKLRKPVAARAQRAHVGFLSINTSLAGKLFKGLHAKAHSGPRFLLHFLIKDDIIGIESQRGKKNFKWIIIKRYARAWAIDVVPEPKARTLKRTLLKIIPLFWDRRKNAVTTAKDLATFPLGFRHGLGRHK